MSEQENTAHLGELVRTEEVLELIGKPAEATFNNWKNHSIYVAHSISQEDGISNMYYVNCVKVRQGCFIDLKTRKHPRKFIQSSIGKLFEDEFGAADEHLKEFLLTKKVNEIIKISLEKFIR